MATQQTTMRKYNPCLAGMIQKWRDKLKRVHGLDTSEYSNEQLFAVIEIWTGTETPDGQFDGVAETVREAQFVEAKLNNDSNTQNVECN